MSVRIRMKKLGRKHQPFFRICAIDKRSPRHGRVLEELGTYDPRVRETDARAILNAERIDYWIGVGAQPSEKVAVLIKKYGTNGTHLDAQKSALEKLTQPRAVPDPGAPAEAPAAAPQDEGAEATATEGEAAAESSSAESPPAEGGDAEPAAAAEEKSPS